MRHGEFTVDDVKAYLNQELPGFEPELIRNMGGIDESITLRVRARQTFAAYTTMPDEFLFVPIPQQSYELQRYIDTFVRKTRQDIIQKLGLQKEIDLEVQRKINAERQRIENEAYRKAMNDALSRVAKEQEKAREELAAGIWNTFMGREYPKPEVSDDAPGD